MTTLKQCSNQNFKVIPLAVCYAESLNHKLKQFVIVPHIWMTLYAITQILSIAVPIVKTLRANTSASMSLWQEPRNGNCYMRILRDNQVGIRSKVTTEGVRWPGLPHGPKTDRDGV